MNIKSGILKRAETRQLARCNPFRNTAVSKQTATSYPKQSHQKAEDNDNKPQQKHLTEMTDPDIFCEKMLGWSNYFYQEIHKMKRTYRIF